LNSTPVKFGVAKSSEWVAGEWSVVVLLACSAG
jgi:hypothetical protein